METMQLTKYGDGGPGFYTWHADTGLRGSTGKRRLSVTVQLSAGDAYAGGDFQLLLGPEGARNMTRQAGYLVAFPSTTYHQVAPVTAGTRYSLVAWFEVP